MALEAFCPNGHRILCPEDRAGRVARCPKCGLAYRIPEPAANRGAGGATASAESPEPAPTGAVLSNDPNVSQASAAAGASDSAIFGLSGLQGGAEPAGQDELFLFLCPSGHKLHGSKRMAGKVGRCPQCNARFEIPLPAAVEDQNADGEDTVTEDPLLHAEAGGSGGALDVPELAPLEGDEVNNAHAKTRTGGSSSVLGGSKPANAAKQPLTGRMQPGSRGAAGSGNGASGGGHPLAALVARLWDEREHGGIVELHLRGGALLTPEWFDERLSRGSYGLFAAPAADGSVSMTIVPWEEVTRVIVRGIVGIPDGLFE
jgi:hypothetical protein